LSMLRNPYPGPVGHAGSVKCAWNGQMALVDQCARQALEASRGWVVGVARSEPYRSLTPTVAAVELEVTRAYASLRAGLPAPGSAGTCPVDSHHKQESRPTPVRTHRPRRSLKLMNFHPRARRRTVAATQMNPINATATPRSDPLVGPCRR